ncbi:MAG TPA: Flp pilus assembly protein CpaB [Bryobacteraceae bacterium]|nr:Flp pilus assembly protein CpaB [Bryobacteraceae bacterium]
MPGFRRNLVLLICIAFVAASAATAIFYGLIGGKLREAARDVPRQRIVVAAHNLERGAVLKAADVRLSVWSGAEPMKSSYTSVDQVTGKTVYSAIEENEPVTGERIAAQDGVGGLGIPVGMRAISVRPSDSAGVVAMLRSGYKVDMQVWSEKPGGEVKLRRIAENVEVLAVQAREPGKRDAPAVTLLVTPRDADILALADSAARVRLLLRNPIDQGEEARQVMTMVKLFGESNGGRQAGGKRPTARSAGDGRIAARVELLVRVFTADRKALTELAGRSADTASATQVTALASDRERVLRRLLGDRRIKAVSTIRLGGQSGERLGMQAVLGAGGAVLDIQFVPVIKPSGALRVRVKPEIHGSPSTVFSVREMETEIEVTGRQSFAITGLDQGSEELAIVVTPELDGVSGASLARRR